MDIMNNLDQLDSYLLSKSKLSIFSIQPAKTKENEVKKLTSSMNLPSTSWKSGEIFRTKCGKFLFLCKYCDAVCGNLPEMMEHINIHFDKTKFTEMSESPLTLPVNISSDKISLESNMKKTTDTLNRSNSQNLANGNQSTDQTKPLKKQSIPKTNFQKPSTKRIEIRHTEKLASPSTKVVKVVKLKRIQFTPSNNTSKKVKVSELKSGLGTPENPAKIAMPSEVKLEPVDSNRRSNESVPSSESTRTENKDYVHVPKRNRHSCYQCEMEPRIYEPSDPRRHICLFCPIWFPNHGDFEIHVNQIHNKNPNYVMCKDFYCYVCEKKFDFRHYLTKHLKVHRETADHLCAICGVCFKAKYQLTAHMSIHNDKIYECDRCTKKFKQFVRFRKHLWCHNTNLSFICKICSKPFKMKRYLQLHMAIHDEPKIHCRICNASFHFKSVRRAHEKSVHNVM